MKICCIALLCLAATDCFGMLTRTRILRLAQPQVLLKSLQLVYKFRPLSQKPMSRLFVQPRNIFLQARRAGSCALVNYESECAACVQPCTNLRDILPNNMDQSWLDLIHAVVKLYTTRNSLHKKHGLVLWHELMFIDGIIYGFSSGNMFNKVKGYRENLVNLEKTLKTLYGKIDISVHEKSNIAAELTRVASNLTKIDEIISVLKSKN